MTALALLAVLAPTTYGFGPGTRLEYDVKVVFEGFLPVLGGNEGVVDVTMGVLVTGAEKKAETLQAASEITAFDLVFNGAKLPLTVENVTQFFPKTTIELTPAGRIVATDAPDRQLPVRLPGLDVKRFPDITYVPLELPEEPLETGNSWTFERDFGGQPLRYECNVMLSTDETAKVAVRVAQSYTVLENDAYEVVADRASAAREVVTTLAGTGVVTFDLKRGAARSVQMTNTATGAVTDLTSGEKSQRKLVTKLEVRLKGAEGGALQASNPRPTRVRVAPVWERAARMARDAWSWLQLASVFGLVRLPGELEAWVAPIRPQVARYLPWLVAR